MIFTLLLPAAFLPFGEHFADGNRESFADFWHDGGGFVFSFIGVVAGVLSYGLLRARRWARHLVVGLSWSLVVITVAEWRVPTDVAVAFLMFGCLPSWYFYFRLPVRKYFGI